MATHYQLGLGITRSLCGADNDDPRKCILECDYCENRVVDCPCCISIAETLRTNLNERMQRSTTKEP